MLIHRNQPLEFDGGHIDGTEETSLVALLASAMTLADVAERLNVSLRQVQAFVDDGSLVAVDIGRGDVRKRLRILESDFDGFLVRRRTKVSRARAFEAPRDVRPKPLPPNPSFAERRAALKARAAR